MSGRPRVHDHDAIIQLYKMPMSGLAVGLALGIPKSAVYYALEAAGETRRPAHRHRAAIVPAWVPLHLHERYRATAAKRGETYAAAEARRLKKETST